MAVFEFLEHAYNAPPPTEQQLTTTTTFPADHLPNGTPLTDEERRNSIHNRQLAYLLQKYSWYPLMTIKSVLISSGYSTETASRYLDNHSSSTTRCGYRDETASINPLESSYLPPPPPPPPPHHHHHPGYGVPPQMYALPLGSHGGGDAAVVPTASDQASHYATPTTSERETFAFEKRKN